MNDSNTPFAPLNDPQLVPEVSQPVVPPTSNAPTEKAPAKNIPIKSENAGTKSTSKLRDKLNKLKPNRAQPPQQPKAGTPTRQNTQRPNSTSAGTATKRATPIEGRIMTIDDEETNILTVEAYLQRVGYQDFVSTMDSRDALAELHTNQPDVLLLDIRMPHVSGLDILRSMSMDSKLRHIPVIVLTAATDPTTKQQALDLGASDFLTKPVDPHDLVPRVRNALTIKKHMDEMADQNARLEHLVKRRTEDLFNSRQQLILSLARAAEHRDDDTGNHVIRVGRYAGLIASELGWSEQRVQMIEQAAQLHDVGKIGIPDSILFKPGKLEPNEWTLMKKHCSFGAEIIEPFSGKELQQIRSHAGLGAEILHIRSSPMLMMATRIAQTHHERWDGSGYPLGLAGEDIPIEGRITAVADVFDALSSERPYKKAFSREKCFSILEEGRGSHFDARVLDAFFVRSEEIIRVQLELMDRH